MNPSPVLAFALLAVLLIGVGGAFLVWGFLAVVLTLGPLIAIVGTVRYFMRLGTAPASR